MNADGTNVVRAEMQLSVLLVTDAMLFNSVTLRLDDMDQESFLSQPLYNYFIDGLAAIIPCPKENVFVFNIQVSQSNNGRDRHFLVTYPIEKSKRNKPLPVDFIIRHNHARLRKNAPPRESIKHSERDDLVGEYLKGNRSVVGVVLYFNFLLEKSRKLYLDES